MASYFYPDELAALQAKAKVERCSLSEVLRRAVRAYLGIGGTGGTG